jgi:PEP-CTERM motif-containing protein
MLSGIHTVKRIRNREAEMNRIMLRMALIVVALMATVGLDSVFATPVGLHVRLTDPGTGAVVLVGDQDFVGVGGHTAGDSNPMLGVVIYSGTVGSGWSVTVTTGISKPILGSPSEAHMDLNTVAVGVGDLIIELSDTGFFGVPSGVTSGGLLIGSVGGTTGATSTAAFTAYKSTTGELFAVGTPSVDLGPYGGPSFSGTAITPHGPLASDYSMTLKASVHHTTVGTTSFDFEVKNTVPEPATIVLLGGGLLALGLGSLRRRA